MPEAVYSHTTQAQILSSSIFLRTRIVCSLMALITESHFPCVNLHSVISQLCDLEPVAYSLCVSIPLCAKFVSFRFWRLEVQDQGSGKVLLKLLCFAGRGLPYPCAYILLASLSLLLRTPVILDQGPTLMSSFNLNYI